MVKLFKLLCVIIAIFSISLFLFGMAWYSSENYQEKGVVILNYHQVSDEHYSSLNMHPKDFDIQMKYLKNNGYHPITIAQLDDYLERGALLPDKPVLITFDDGYEDNYKYAFPILKKYHFPATIFIIGDALNVPRFLKIEQIKEMMAHGIEFQSHTFHHKPIPQQDPELLAKDLVEEETLFLKEFGYPPKYIAYPGGYSSPDSIAIVKNAHYRLGFTVDPGWVKRGDSLLELPRTPIFEVPYRNLCFAFRLHFPDFVGELWRLRMKLIKHGYQHYAEFIPTF